MKGVKLYLIWDIKYDFFIIENRSYILKLNDYYIY